MYGGRGCGLCPVIPATRGAAWPLNVPPGEASGPPPYGRHIAKRSGGAKIPGRLPIIKDYALMRRALSLLAKITISILLLYLSLRSVDLAALGARLSRLESG